MQATFAAARETNPTATLLLNDFDMSADYERLIEDCLEAGIRIDALGLQSHMHQGYWGVEKTLDVLERFSRFGLPIHFTESTLVSGRPDAARDRRPQRLPGGRLADDARGRGAPGRRGRDATTGRCSGTRRSRRSRGGGFPDGGWLDAPTGLVRVDGSPKPAYERLRGLVKGEWWLPPTTMRTDDAGRIRLTGFLGDYEVTSRGRTAGFALEAPGSVEARAVLPA